MNYFKHYSLFRFLKSFLLIILFLPNLFSQSLKQEENENIGLFSHNPDATFRLLKEKYNKANEQKNVVQAGIYLQQMGQICYHFGHYPQALDFHLQASKIFKANQKKELLAENLNDLGVCIITIVSEILLANITTKLLLFIKVLIMIWAWQIL